MVILLHFTHFIHDDIYVYLFLEKIKNKSVFLKAFLHQFVFVFFNTPTTRVFSENIKIFHSCFEGEN